MTPNICFLNYINRSGSTLLSKELNKFSAIGVSLEAEIMDGIHIGSPLLINNKNELTNYLDEIYRNKKFKQWNIDYSVLLNKLDACQYPIKFNTILLTILELYFQKDSLNIFIYKRNDYFRFFKQLRRLFPHSKFLFIQRDPRAVYNSQKRSLDSQTRKPMSKNIVQFAVRYKKTISYINENLRLRKWFYRIDYEELIMDKEKILSKILKFLGITNQKKEDSDYFKDIPKDQEHLHKNLKHDGLKKNRIDAWKNELSPVEINFLQKVLLNELNRYDSIKNSHLSFMEKIQYHKLVMWFVVYFKLSMLKRKIIGY